MFVEESFHDAQGVGDKKRGYSQPAEGQKDTACHQGIICKNLEDEARKEGGSEEDEGRCDYSRADEAVKCCLTADEPQT